MTLVVEDESPLNLTSSGFAIQIGDWQQEGVMSGEYEIPLPKEWVTGTEVTISIVEDLMAGFGEVGGDLYTGEPFDVWSNGTLIIDEKGWGKPLTLHIGESAAYVDSGSWAKFKVSPQSGRMSYIRKAQSAVDRVSTKLKDFERSWDERQRQNNRGYSFRCGLDFPWKLNSDGTASSVSNDSIELYFLLCSVHIQNVYVAQAQNLAEFVKFNDDYLRSYGKLNLVQSLESVSDAIEEVANRYEREGRYLGSRSDFEKALVYIKSSGDAVDGAIAAAQKLNSENGGKLRIDATKLTTEWLKRCVKDGESCK